MSTIKVDTITDEAGSGAPDFPNGMTGNGSSLTGLATAAQGALASTALQSSSSLAAANLTGTLPAIDGSALTGVGSSTDFGAVGTYTWGRPKNTAGYDGGETVSGITPVSYNTVSTLGYYTGGSNGTFAYAEASSTLGGTWRAMGNIFSNGGIYNLFGLWVRIS